MTYNYKNEDTLSINVKETARGPGLTQRLPVFYALWILVAALSSALGYSSISPEGALIMLGGIVCTGSVFAAAAILADRSAEGREILTLQQCVVAAAWIAAFAYFSRDALELVLGMYVTLLIYAMYRVGTRRLFSVATGIFVGFLVAKGLQILADPSLFSPETLGLQFLLLFLVVGGLVRAGIHLRQLREALQERNHDLERVLDRVTRLAKHDHLTKSYSRMYIMELLAREKARADRSGKTFSVLLFDLDHFKMVNDQYGHIVGDQILSDFANLVRTELRGMDTVNHTLPEIVDTPDTSEGSLGRFGGEEFLTVLPGTNARGAEFCADRIRRRICGKAFRNQYNITVSAGVAEYVYGESVQQLLTRADDALYKAKRAGRNRVCLSVPPEHEETGTVPNLRILK